MDIMAMKRPPLSSDYDNRSPAVKRRRHNPPITIEKLPTEILQQIFFASLNGNLLKASSRIAVKLSGSQNIYRASFFIAFYHHKLLELRKEFRFEYLLPVVELPVPFWELRSMVKAVLDSRWCKWSWVKSLLFGRLQEAATTFGRDYASGECSRAGDDAENRGESSEIADFLKTASSSQSLGLHRTSSFCRGVGILGAENELHTNLFNMAIISRPSGSKSSNYDDEGYDWEVTEHWRLQFHPFGDIPLEIAKLDEFYMDDARFRDLIHRSFGICGISVRQNALDMWKRMQGRLYDAIAIGDNIKLRHMLQMDYFLRPETVPYQVPTKLFRAAALSDYNRLRDEDEGLQMLLLHVLFSIDPQSLPRYETTVEIHQWALLAQSRVRTHSRDRHAARVDMKWDLRDDELSDQAKREARNSFRQNDYVQTMDIEILRFLCKGELARKSNRTSPDFAAPVLWSLNEPVNDKEIIVEDVEELCVVREMTIKELQVLVGGIIAPLESH